MESIGISYDILLFKIKHKRRIDGNTQEDVYKRQGMAYFRSRGFRDDIIEKFQLGYCTESHDALAQDALKKGYKKDYLVKTCLLYTSRCV